MKKKKKVTSFSELSNCCGEEMKIVGGDEETMFFQCLGCGKGCDPMIPKKLSNVRKPKLYSFDEVEKMFKKLRKKIENLKAKGGQDNGYLDAIGDVLNEL